jgi:regulatory protein
MLRIAFIMMKNDLNQIWNIALGLIGRRNHTAIELERKLLQRGYDKENVRKIILKCSQLQIIDDKISGRLYLNELIRKGYGPYRIKYVMSQKGLDNHLIDELLFEENVEKNERNLCEQVLAKKIKMVSKKKDPKKIKALLHRFLLSRGFSSSVILDLLQKYKIE